MSKKERTTGRGMRRLVASIILNARSPPPCEKYITRAIRGSMMGMDARSKNKRKTLDLSILSTIPPSLRTKPAVIRETSEMAEEEGMITVKLGHLTAITALRSVKKRKTTKNLEKTLLDLFPPL